MNLIFLFNAITCLVFSGYFLIKTIRNSDEKKKKTLHTLAWIFSIYLILALLFLIGTFGLMEIATSDFYWIYAFVLIAQVFLLFDVGYHLSNDKRFSIFRIFFVLASLISIIYFSNETFLKIMISFCGLVTGFFFMQITFLGIQYKKLAYSGVLYSVILFFSGIFLILGWGNPLWHFLIASVFLFRVFSTLFYDLGKYSFEVSDAEKEKHKYLSFLNSLFFILVLINFVFIGTIFIHEMGHYSASKVFECEFQQLVYDGSFFHTDVICDSNTTTWMVVLAGMILPYILAILLVAVGGIFLEDIGMLIIGFNSVSLSMDLSQINVSPSFSFIIIIVGILFIIDGVLSLIRSKLEISIFN